ncbi:MAG: indolepyruvate ferredoxin oxidoreductase subunit beta [Candidatus Lokiarchaeota archaeon]|nr:indolepyruvate ferredoxin oxidoreductase subunit beta [Candidatus Lokiarchaeota archaeon]
MSGDTRNTINIVISGVGGQGVLTLAEILAKTALASSHNVRVGEIHGMAQRGGHVVCTVRIGPNAHGPIVDPGTADLLVGFEPVETLREISSIKQDGYVLLSTHVQYPVSVSMGKSEYPSQKEILSELNKFTPNIFEIDAMKFAKKAGSSRSLNMVMLGAIIGTGLTPLTKQAAIESVTSAFSKRFEPINSRAVELGFEEISKQFTK